MREAGVAVATRRDPWGRRLPPPLHAANGSWGCLCRPDLAHTGRGDLAVTTNERRVTCRTCLKIIASRKGARR